MKSIDTIIVPPKPEPPIDPPDPNALTAKQELFCQYYTQLSDTYGNGRWSYALAYNYDLANADKGDAEWDEAHKNIIEPSTFDRMANTCDVNASRLLRVDKVLKRVRELKATRLDDDEVFDSRLLDIVEKGKDTDALAAIKHRNEIKQRVTKKISLDGTINTSPYRELTAEELRALAAGGENGQD